MSKVDELIASSLLPNGLLEHHMLATVDESKISKNFNTHIISDNIINIQKLIYPYLKEKRTIEIELIKKICLYSFMRDNAPLIASSPALTAGGSPLS